MYPNFALNLLQIAMAFWGSIRIVRAPCQVFEQLLQEKEDTYHRESLSCCGNSTRQWLENELVVGHTHELSSTHTVHAPRARA